MCSRCGPVVGRVSRARPAVRSVRRPGVVGPQRLPSRAHGHSWVPSQITCWRLKRRGMWRDRSDCAISCPGSGVTAMIAPDKRTEQTCRGRLRTRSSTPWLKPWSGSQVPDSSNRFATLPRSVEVGARCNAGSPCPRRRIAVESAILLVLEDRSVAAGPVGGQADLQRVVPGVACFPAPQGVSGV